MRMTCRNDAIIGIVICALRGRRGNTSALETFVPLCTDRAIIARGSIRLSLREASSKYRVATRLHTIGRVIQTNHFRGEVLRTFLVLAFPNTVAGVSIIENLALSIYDAGTNEDSAVANTILAFLVSGTRVAIITRLPFFQFIDANPGRTLVDCARITIVALVYLPSAGSVVTVVIKRAEIAIRADGVSRCIDGGAFARVGLTDIEPAWIRIHITNHVVPFHTTSCQTHVAALAEVFHLRAIGVDYATAFGIQGLALTAVTRFILRTFITVVAYRLLREWLRITSSDGAARRIGAGITIVAGYWLSDT